MHYPLVMEQICVSYKRYGVELRERLESATSDTYHSLVLRQFEAAVTESRSSIAVSTGSVVTQATI